MLLNR